MYRVIKFLEKLEDKTVDFIFLLVFLIGIYFTADSIYVFYNSRALNVKAVHTVEEIEEVKQQLTDDFVAWLTIDDTTINYPIMQGVDNSEYLNKDPYGNYALAGSIFLDSRNESDFSDGYNLVYGHHMSGGYMFGALDYFADPEYFNSHLKSTLEINNKIYQLEIFAYINSDAKDDIIFDVEKGGDRFSYIRSHAVNYVEPVSKGNLIIFSTCHSPLSTKRLCLCAILIPLNSDN